jgi:hypothetical protein
MILSHEGYPALSFHSGRDRAANWMTLLLSRSRARAKFSAMSDLGLLALRGVGFLLAFTFGIQKIGWYVVAFHSDKPFSSIGLAPLIAKIGFPMPVILALWVTFN